VYKRGNTWSVVIDHGRDPATGKRKRVWHLGFTTLREAAEARTRLLRERDTGAVIDPSHQTLAEYLRDEVAAVTQAHDRPHRPQSSRQGRHPDVGLLTAVIWSGTSSHGLVAWHLHAM
jgi:hypothetical protein